MSQAIFSSINPNTTSGTDLATILNDFKDAMVTGLSGTSRPSNLQAGGYWIDTTNNPTTWAYKMYTGATDVTIFTLNLSTGVATMASADTLFEIAKVSNDAVGPILRLLKERIAGGGQVLDGDSIGEISFYGTRDSGVNVEQAAIRAYSSDNVTASAQGAYLVFEVTNDAAAAVTEAMRLVDSKLGIGTATPEDALHVVGNAIRSEKASDDTVGSKFVGKKGRVAGDGQVENGDIVLEVEALAKDDAASFNAIAAIRMEAIEDQTATAQGSRVVIATTPVTGIGQDDIVQVTSALVTIDTDLTVAGNLVVQGTTSLESTVVEIEDAAIILNKGGDQASANAQDSGFVVEMSDATDAGIGYDSTMASKFKIGEIGSQEEIVTVGHTQTLTDKTLDTAVIDDSEINTPSKLDMKQDTQANLETYAATATNGQLCFATDTKVAYQVVDNALVELGSGSGGGINYVLNPEYKIDTTGNTAYKDAAGTEPVDGAGGSPTLAITRSTSSPLAGVASGVIGKPPSNVQGEGINIALTDFDIADKGKKVLISFEYDASDADYVDADFRVFIYDNTNAALIRVSDEDIKGGKGTHYATFQVPYNCDSASLLIHCATTDTLSYDLKIDRISVGPTPYATSAVVLDWEEFTPTGSWIANTTYTGFYRRVGDSAEVFVRVATSGTPTTATLQVNLPTGLALDSSKLVGVVELGTAWISDSSTPANRTKGSVSDAGSNNLQIFYIGGSTVTQAAPFAFATGDEVVFRATVPIQGWSSNAVSSIDLGARDIKSVAKNSATTAVGAGAAIHFANVTENTGGVMWTSSTQFTPIETSDYLFSGMITATAAINTWDITVYNVTDAAQASEGSIGFIDAAVLVTYSGVVKLVKGKTYEIRSSDAFTPSAVGTQTAVIKKLASPQTIFGTELVNMRYTSNSGQPIGATATDLEFEDLSNDTHGMYNTATGVATIPYNGVYDIGCSYITASATWTSGNALVTSIVVNGSSIKDGLKRTGAYTATESSSVIAKGVRLNKGDLVKIQGSNSQSAAMSTTGSNNDFTITRIGD